MALQVYFENKRITFLDEVKYASCLKQHISEQYGIPVCDLFVTVNGRIATENVLCESGTVRVNCRLVGGKGGFGSMLRAIGAQIEKTTNREACRDLSGRRLRDINEEKRLRKWLEGQSDREREAAERKQKKLERLMAEPRVDTKMDDPVYEKERQNLPERTYMWSIALLAVLSLVLARPNEFDDEYDTNDNNQATNKNDDVSRVQIKVYRGPTNHDGHAPWGFWVKQPTDDE